MNYGEMPYSEFSLDMGDSFGRDSETFVKVI
jgi:hypothetical protein